METRSWDDLSPDIHVEILKRLPPKSLVCCMCTSKSMFSTVSSPSFMASRSGLGPDGLHMYSYSLDGFQRFFLSRDNTVKGNRNRNRNDMFDLTAVNKIVNSPVDPTYFLIGLCDGLVCFSNHVHRQPNIAVWNPFFGKYLTLPMAPLPTCDRGHQFGFGFDRSTLDYKVVRVGISPNHSGVWADVHTVHTFTWKQGFRSISQPASNIMGSGVCIEGVVHWIMRAYSGEHYSILTFDLAKESFGEIKINDTKAHHKSITLTKFTINGIEKLVVYHVDHVCNVWLLEEYGVADSWKKLCAIDVGNDYGKVLCAQADGEIIVCSILTKKLFSYNPITEMRKYFTIGHKAHLEYVGLFVPSLVFPVQYRRALCGKRMRLEEEEREDEEMEDEKDSKEEAKRRKLIQPEEMINLTTIFVDLGLN